MRERGVWRGVVVAVLASGAGVAAVAVAARSPLSLADLGRIHPLWLGAATAAMVAAWWLRALRIALLAHALGHRLPVSRALRYYLISCFVAHVTPSSSGGGPALVYLLSREGLAVGRATALVVVESAFTALILLAAAPVLLLAWRAGLGMDWHPRLLDAVLAGSLLAAALVAYFLFRPRDLARVAERLLSQPWVRTVVARARLEDQVARLRREGARYAFALRLLMRRRPEVVALTAAYTVFYWVAYLAVAPALLRGLGVLAPLGAVTAIQVAFNLFQPVIPTPGASGGAEIAFAYLFRAIVPASRLWLFVALWRVLTFHLSLVVGALFSLAWLLRGRLVPSTAVRR